MKLVRPGSAAPQPLHLGAGAQRRLRLGRAAGLLLAAGWLLALVLAPARDASATGLAIAGMLIGTLLAARPWGRQPERSLQLMVAVGALHAAAAMVALDPAATATAPLFLAVGVLAGLIGRGRAAVLGSAAALAAIAVVVTAVAPARAAGALGHALLLAPAIMLAASLAAGAVALHTARATRALRAALPGLGDPGLAHGPLAERARRDPDRFARLALDLDLQAGRGASVAEGNRLLHDIADALIAHTRVTAMARRQATESLVDRLERTVANIELEELGWFNFEQAYAQPLLSDDDEAAELLARADEALREARERRGRRPLPIDAETGADVHHVNP